MATLPSRAVTASEVLNYRFDSVSFAKGYDRLAVNDLLHQAAKVLGAWENVTLTTSSLRRQMMPVLIATTKQLSSQLSLCAKQPTLMC